MQVELVSLQQKLDLNSGEMQNSISLRLPNGKMIELPIDNNESLEVIRATRWEAPRQEEMPEPSYAAPAPEPEEVEEPSPIGYVSPAPTSGMPTGMPRPSYGNEEARSFAGDDDAEAAAVFGGPVVSGTLGPPPQPQVSSRGRQVSMNEFGYPIVPRAGMDPGEVTGSGSEADEDGVSSI